MDKKLIQLMVAYLAKQHGITEEAAAELLFEKNSESGEVDKTKLNEDALTTLLAKDTERVETLKTAVDKTEIYNKAHADAKKEVLGKVEKKIAEKYGVESDKIETLVDSIVTAQVAGVKAADKMTDDDIKRHPTYLALERSKTEEITALNNSHTEAIDTLKSGFAKTEVLSTVKKEVLTHFDGLKPVLSKDGTKAANQRTDFANKFEGYDYQPQEGGGYLVLKDGKRVEDPHGNPMTLDKLVHEKASTLFDFAVQDPKGAPGSGAGEGSGSGTVEVPKDEAAYNKAIFAAETPEARAEITAAYEATQGD